MDLSHTIALLGSYHGEPAIAELLTLLGIDAAPRLKRGDSSAFLLKRELGVELTFVRERDLDVPPAREYPEGALVLDNVRFYGPGLKTFQAFGGRMPDGLAFGRTLDDLRGVFGEPAWHCSDLNRARWDREGHAVFAGFDDTGRSDVLAVQLPVEPDEPSRLAGA
ncbi:hypothetical protein [Roseateles chitosanitabidus]|uniref:hypothetical protein n=1 Tax=Roseateles chitosanitabidus TaxID=65048 RepID=UPI000829E5BB|nr:hypothetical protein [Roseateles chitosanitabidus]